MKITVFCTLTIVYACLLPCYGIKNKIGVLVVKYDNLWDEYIKRYFNSNVQLEEDCDFNNLGEFFCLSDSHKIIEDGSTERKVENTILNRISRQATNLTSVSPSVTDIRTKITINDSVTPTSSTNGIEKHNNNIITKEKLNSTSVLDIDDITTITDLSHSISTSKFDSKKQNNTIPQNQSDFNLDSSKSAIAANTHPTVNLTLPSNGTVKQINYENNVQNVIIPSPSSDKSLDFWMFVVCILGLTILSSGTVFVVYKKWLRRGRHGCYQIGDMCQCRNNNETPV